MSSTASTTFRGHPIAVAAAEIHELLDTLIDQSTWSMTDEETRSTVCELTRAEARVAELKLRVAAHAQARRVGDESGATSTAVWWANQTRITRGEAARSVKLTQAFDTDRHEAVRAALAAGAILVDQASVIVRAVDELPDEVEPWVPAKAERLMLDQARDHDAKALRILGKRIFEVVDSDAADAHEARLLESEEEEARETASLRMVDDGHGKIQGRFTIPTLHGAILKKALMAIAAPKHQAAVHGSAPAPGRPSDRRLGQAFMAYIERYPADLLPRAGGVNATVVATTSLDALRNGLKAAKLDTGEKISIGEIRRLSCEAGIIPAVLGGKSQVLDLGRKNRFHNESQRVVAGIEQGGCRTEGCDWPPGMCHLHHPKAWSKGGGTNRDAIMLCPRHHALAHHPGYDVTHQPGSKVSFHRRT